VLAFSRAPLNCSGLEGRLPVSAVCPSCSADSPVAQLRRRFVCPSCSVRLSASVGFALLVAVVLWVLVDVVLMIVFSVLAPGNNLPALLARYGVSAAAGLGILGAVLRRLAKIGFAS